MDRGGTPHDGQSNFTSHTSIVAQRDGIVCRLVHHQVPPKVEYGLTEWGQELCPALDALLTWAEARVTL